MCCSLITCMANVRNSVRHCGQLQGMPHKWWKVQRCNYLYHLCSIGICRIKCYRSWGWNNLGKLHVEICWKRWGTCADGEVGQISAWYYHHAVIALRVKCQVCDSATRFLSHMERALKLHQYSCTSWGTGGTGCHTKWLDGYMSAIFLISLLREYIVNFTGTTSIAKNLLHWISCPPPPPTDINMDLHNSRARLQMLLWKDVAP